MGGNRWEWMGVDGSGWEWVEVAGAWLSKTHNKIYLDIFRKNKKTE